jgi:hypothetical protein
MNQEIGDYMLTLDSTLDTIKQFPFEQREELIDILRKRQSQEWRQDTAEYYNNIINSVRAGESESLSADEAIHELHKSLSTTD